MTEIFSLSRVQAPVCFPQTLQVVEKVRASRRKWREATATPAYYSASSWKERQQSPKSFAPLLLLLFTYLALFHILDTYLADTIHHHAHEGSACRGWWQQLCLYQECFRGEQEDEHSASGGVHFDAKTEESCTIPIVVIKNKKCIVKYQSKSYSLLSWISFSF